MGVSVDPWAGPRRHGERACALQQASRGPRSRPMMAACTSAATWKRVRPDDLRRTHGQAPPWRRVEAVRSRRPRGGLPATPWQRLPAAPGRVRSRPEITAAGRLLNATGGCASAARVTRHVHGARRWRRGCWRRSPPWRLFRVEDVLLRPAVRLLSRRADRHGESVLTGVMSGIPAGTTFWRPRLGPCSRRRSQPSNSRPPTPRGSRSAPNRHDHGRDCH
jgi:hypothetical protein